ncbi:MAG: hypothetical protein RDV41_06235 [Planctomycetota bacterium]|nr:hypothetical protein [Planctomycetota bacterium]
MHDLWKTERHFIIAVGTAVVGLLALLFVVLPKFNEATVAENKTREARKFIDDSSDSDEWQTAADVRAIEAEISTLQETYDRLKESVLLPKDERFSMRGSDSDPLLFFSSRREEVMKNIEKSAARHNIGIPKTLNFREEEITREAVPLLLRRLAVVERLANLAIDAEVQSIVQFIHAREVDDFAGYVPPPEDFVRGSMVMMEVQCHFNSLATLAHGTQKKGNLLQLYKVNVEKAQAEGEIVKATIIGRALDVNETVTVRATAPAGEESGEDQGGSKWRPGR